jgi:hypothetical protein
MWKGQDNKITCNILFAHLYAILQLKKTQRWAFHAFPNFYTNGSLKRICKNLQHFFPTHSYVKINVLVTFI